MSANRRKSDRINFDRGYAAYMMAIDGTWRRPCSVLDVSASGARLIVDGTIEGLNLKEFFLVLSSTGLAYRRCELVRINGDEIGVNFLLRKEKEKKPARQRGNEHTH